MTAKELANRTREAALAIQCPLDGSELPPDRESPEGGPSPEAEVEKAERRRLVAEGIAALPEKEKLVISLIYQENLTGREVASVLGVSPSRVSQLHSRALVRLRAHLDGAEER